MKVVDCPRQIRDREKSKTEPQRYSIADGYEAFLLLKRDSIRKKEKKQVVS